MITRIGPGASTEAACKDKKTDPEIQKIRGAAQEFETMLVRQLLTATKAVGKGGEGGYGAMAVDALAQGIGKSGGLGLARQIEEAVSRSLRQKGTPEVK